MVLAIIDGQPLTEVPRDLFIPPDALEVFLDSFSGPLDLLLYLIRKQNIDILDIPIAHITEQYMQYIQLMEMRRLELKADYLVMAAMLAEIKSRLLLPQTPILEEVEDDPRLALVKKLQVYEQFKQLAMQLDALPRSERDVFRFAIQTPAIERTILYPEVELSQLVTLMQALMESQRHLSHHQISRETLSVKERMACILERLQTEKQIKFTALLQRQEGRIGLVVSFLAILELAKRSLLVISQISAEAPIYLQVVGYG